MSNTPQLFFTSSQNLSGSRDPFSKFVPEGPVIIFNQEPVGMHVKGLIMSSKNGVVLEDDKTGAVYFLSEGERANNVLVKSISKTNVVVELNGNQVELSVMGAEK